MSSQPKRVLIVDDEPSIRYVLTKQLEELGYQCVAVSTGQEALALLAQQGVDLVLLDVRMPGMSGLDVLRRLRVEHPQTRVVMLTALANADLGAQALRLGAADYMTKPYSLEDLISRLQRALAPKEPLPQDGVVGSPQMPVDERKVTMDLIGQQVSAIERLSEPKEQAKAKSKRSWWPWGRR